MSFWKGVAGWHCARSSISSKLKTPESKFFKSKSSFAGAAGCAGAISSKGVASFAAVESDSTTLDFFQKANDIFQKSDCKKE
jgi:hypothetical protein